MSKSLPDLCKPLQHSTVLFKSNLMLFLLKQDRTLLNSSPKETFMKMWRCHKVKFKSQQ